jgi:hypothetical protein
MMMFSRFGKFPLLQAGLLFAVFFWYMAGIQFATPNMPDNDGYYHIKMAYLMRVEGLKPAFPWLPLTILNEREFYDHHFLFHVALIPFTFGDLRLGAKWAAVTFSSLAFLVIWWLLRREGVPYSWVWSLALLAISEAFLFRMSITRAQSLSLAVLALGLHWMLQGKWPSLAILAFVYVWMYDAFPLLAALAFLYGLSAWMTESRPEFRPLLFVLGGTLAGLLINVYFPQNLIFIYRHLLPKLTDATAVSVGNEWFPYDTGQLLRNSAGALILFASGIVALGLRNERMDRGTATALLGSLLFGWMLFQARRFIEYFPAFALIFAALTWSPLLKRLQLQSPTKWVPALLTVAMLTGMSFTYPAARESIRSAKSYQLYFLASKWLEANTAPGERVFQTDWDDFPRLFFYNTHNTYLVGLDPTYMQLYDPALYDLWVKVTQGQVEKPSDVIRQRFGARFVITDLKHGAFLQQAASDPAMREVYRDPQAVIFEIGP